MFGAKIPLQITLSVRSYVGMYVCIPHVGYDILSVRSCVILSAFRSSENLFQFYQTFGLLKTHLHFELHATCITLTPTVELEKQNVKLKFKRGDRKLEMDKREYAGLFLNVVTKKSDLIQINFSRFYVFFLF